MGTSGGSMWPHRPKGRGMSEYKPRQGSRLRQADVDKITPALSHLIDDNGPLTPPIVVKAAKPKNAPLHEYFEWDNNKAADEFRLEQACRMLASIRIVASQADEDRTVRAFIHSRIEKSYVKAE